MVKVDPAAVCPFDNALGPQDHAVLGLVIQRDEDVFDLVLGEFFRCLAAPAGEDLVGVVPMVMVMMVAAAFRVVALVAVFMLMMMVMLVLVVVVMVMMMVAAAVVMVMVMVMIVMVLVVMMAAAVLIMILVIVVVMMLMLMIVIVLMVMVMVVMGLLVLQRGQLLGQGLGLLNGLLHLDAGQLVPRGGDDGGRVVVAAEHRDNVVISSVRLRTMHDAVSIWFS